MFAFSKLRQTLDEIVILRLPFVDCVLVEYERYAIGLLLGELIMAHHTRTKPCKIGRNKSMKIKTTISRSMRLAINWMQKSGLLL